MKHKYSPPGTKTVSAKPVKKDVKTNKKSQKMSNLKLWTILIGSAILIGGIILIITLGNGQNGKAVPAGDQVSVLPKFDPSKFSPKATDFTLKDTEGTVHKLSDHGGRPVFLDFTTSWCGWCKKQAPDMKKLFQKYGSTVQFFAIDVNEPLNVVKSYKDEESSPWPFLLDENGQVAAQFGVKGYPHYILLSPDGTVNKVQSGYSESFFEVFSGAIEGIIR